MRYVLDENKYSLIVGLRHYSRRSQLRNSIVEIRLLWDIPAPCMPMPIFKTVVMALAASITLASQSNSRKA